jgi:energy-converting hydrogenase B subunit D
MIPLQAVVIALVALGSLAVVLTRDLVRLTMISSLYALTLVVFFLVLQAPDVALSELVVGAIGFPLVIGVAIVLQRGGK